ncbi:hypothetical protein Vretimale_19669 [Volvox reticuliferus]|uniref:Sulfotransferase n=1 Tax=Volvox reticuliferus TaxID=1737510 RepID=A0A8J4FZT2_9CHLO|nr:hypothetical protein Vretifemale_20679 [Volvox reticuliferus]GIM17161.1 hypothetical protein Vretimale_19669 [Volvox reticuliferus]
MQYLFKVKDMSLIQSSNSSSDNTSRFGDHGNLHLEVIGGGFGRTGTATLYAALNMLGYKTHHMIEVISHRDQAAAWLKATRDRAAGRPIDWWPVLGAGEYTAAVDWPSVAFYQELLAANPDAKVVLTLRDFDKWYESVRCTIFAAGEALRSIQPPLYLAPLFRNRVNMAAMTEELIWWGTFGGRFHDRQYTRKVYESHMAEVRRVVPPGQLLEFRVQDGWEPLCAFLGKPVPEQPFPHVNTTAEFRQRIDHLRAISRRLATMFAVSNTLVVTGLVVGLMLGGHMIMRKIR